MSFYYSHTLQLGREIEDLASYYVYYDTLEYYYDIDVTDSDCAGWVEIKERNEILYSSYCYLVRNYMKA